jgi:hypothetical protein
MTLSAKVGSLIVALFLLAVSAVPQTAEFKDAVAIVLGR